MAGETNKKTEEVTAPIVATAPAEVKTAPKAEQSQRFLNRDRQPLRRKNTRRPGRERARQEYDQKLINVRRVARVSKGGRRFSFSVSMILGNRHGSVGVGTGKGADTAIAIEKSTRDAKKNMVHLSLTPSSSISRRVEAKFSSARVMLMPAPGRGVVAGGAVRHVVELAGVKDVTTKIFSSSKNGLNIARAAVAALAQLAPRQSKVAPSLPVVEQTPALSPETK